jgi:tripartite-type tricarboxylate transporter receptor subunit TctC
MPDHHTPHLARRKLLKAATAFSAIGALPVRAQEAFPSRTVTIINPYPGGPTDRFARLVAQKLENAWGKSVVVDGRAGAGGVIGVAAAAKARGDGYTLLITSASTQIVQPVVKKSLPYDVEKDFIPIASTGPVPSVIVAHPSLPVRSLKELIDYARANPNAVTYGSSGLGTALHLAGEVFASEADIKLLHVPYKTAAQSMTDLLGGQVNLMFDSPNNSTPHIKAGKVLGLAVMASERLELLPDVPSTKELGFPEMQFTNWLGIYAPTGTPQSVIDSISTILEPGFKDADMKAYFDASAMPHAALFGDAFVQSSRVQRQALEAVVKKANIPLID